MRRFSSKKHHSSNHGVTAPWQENDPRRTRKARAFLRDAFSDYVAARVLLLANLPYQGAVFSSTAIEKCFKAILALRGKEKHRHLKVADWEALKDFDSNVGDFIREDFVELNSKVYRLRYSDSVEPNFNLVIASREFLAEMDQCVSTLISAIKVNENGVRQKTSFQQATETADNRVLAENHMITGPRKETFIYQKPQFVYEVRRHPVRGLIEVTYSAVGEPKRPGFLREALVPAEGGSLALDFSYFPVQGADPQRDHDINISESG